MATSKQKRRFSQDFSGNSKTDPSFAPKCNVNNIVSHYEKTGVDPFADRAKNQVFGHASSTTYEEAMRMTAEVDSAFAALPSQERARHKNDPLTWLASHVTPEVEYEASQDLSPALPPEDATAAESEVKVQ